MLSRRAWSDVCGRLWKPIVYSLTVVSLGFGIFILSSFPPTQRFGIAVILGTLIAPLAALFVLPWLATAGTSRPDPVESGAGGAGDPVQAEPGI